SLRKDCNKALGSRVPINLRPVGIFGTMLIVTFVKKVFSKDAATRCDATHDASTRGGFSSNWVEEFEENRSNWVEEFEENKNGRPRSMGLFSSNSSTQLDE